MGYIYKITNTENNKCYIGQTTRNYQERWTEHKNSKNKKPYCNWPLYRMLNKVAPEKITWEIIEITENLNEQEEYWINFYNSFNDGYNVLTGGNNSTKYNYQEILQFWLSEGQHNFVKTAQYFNAYPTTIARIIKEFGYNARTGSEINSNDHESIQRKVNQIDLTTGKVLQTYNSLTQAGISLGNKNYGKTISNICRGIRPSYLGYGWQYIEDIGQPIYLNKQIKQIYLPEFDLWFDNKELCADWFIQNNKCRSKDRYQVGTALIYALKHSGKYFNIQIEEQERIINTYYE